MHINICWVITPQNTENMVQLLILYVYIPNQWRAQGGIRDMSLWEWKKTEG